MVKGSLIRGDVFKRERNLTVHWAGSVRLGLVSGRFNRPNRLKPNLTLNSLK